MSESNNDEINENDVIKILVTTDNHLGYEEKDSIRGDDSFVSFEECLQHAHDHNVDMILLGGDLFHVASPSQNSMNRCIKLLRNYVLGDKPIELEFRSDQSVNFWDSLNRTVNYEDPNMNIAIPTFSIHGNHDDPSGYGRLSCMDIVASTGLLNYFGKCLNLEKVVVSPLMIVKGATQLALSGISHIHDSRLVRLFEAGNVIFENVTNENEWFNLLVLHQNRADRGRKKFIPEEVLPKFLDLVIWGHEHDSHIDPEQNLKTKFFVSQPGSTVATSLSEGESLPKHCGILKIYRKQFDMVSIKLQTVRPFVFGNLSLDDYEDELNEPRTKLVDQIDKVITRRINEMIERSKEQLTGHPKQPTLPLIRLRVQFSKESYSFTPNAIQVQFMDKVANPNDIILIQRHVTRTKLDIKVDETAFTDAFDKERQNENFQVEDVVNRYFTTVEGAKNLEIQSTKCMGEVCRHLLREDDDAAEKLIEYHIEMAINHLQEKIPDIDGIDEELENFSAKATETFNKALEMLDKSGFKKVSAARDAFASNSLISDDEPDTGDPSDSAASAPARGRGRGATRSTRARGRTPRGGRGAKAKSPPPAPKNTSSKRQSSIVESFSQALSRQTRTTRSNRKVVYLSDDSD
ncbi:double-strand break repair protein MRE11 [Phlebotomus papatasi]|uniref:double-strand break repair protein MRE11 n=1 Tax=Phlebotomus papatasi TaxID=29031 RepID=UPI00248366B2|nr:double-strand break repair protein MRE11 [Phlebotomus papatasi]